MMISPRKLRPGKLQDAKGFSLLLPIDADDAPFLIGYDRNGELVGVFLSGQFAWCIQQVEEADEWSGLLIEDVRIEVELASAFNLGGSVSSVGSIRVSEAGVELMANVNRTPAFKSAAPIRFTKDAVSVSIENKAFFASWAVVTDEGREKMTLWERGTGESASKY